MYGRIRHSTLFRSGWPVSTASETWRLGHRSGWNQTRLAGSIQRFLLRFSEKSGDLATLAVAPPLALEQAEEPVQRRRRAEAVLLFHRGPVPLRKLAQLAGLADATEARTLLRQLNEIYDKTGSALRVEQVAGGYQLLTRPGLAPWLRRFASAPPSIRLSTPTMETLAIVAYRQPVLRANIEAIRGVACGEILRQLMQRDLVRICGRSEELGRPYLYGTTKHFLQTFGLKDTESLPAVMGASVTDESEDTCANSTDQNQAEPFAPPIDPTSPLNLNPRNLPPSPVSSFDAVNQKESDVSTVCVLDNDDSLALANPGSIGLGLVESPFVIPVREPRAADDEDDDYFDDDDDDDDDDEEEEEVDEVDDVEEDEWDDEEDEEEDEAVDGDDAEDEEVADEWEEVGDEEEEDAEDEEEDDEEEEWEDDEDDDDWDEDDDEEEDDEDEEWD